MRQNERDQDRANEVGERRSRVSKEGPCTKILCVKKEG